MSDILDPSKLKVTELRAELQARGLSTKGNKPVLIERLREALEAEGGCEGHAFPSFSLASPFSLSLFPLRRRLARRLVAQGLAEPPLLLEASGKGF